MRLTLPCALVLSACLAGAARAQSVRWDPPGGSLPVGEVSQLELIFDDCTPDDTPAPPKVDGLTLQYQGQSTNMSLIQGTFTRSVSVTFAALLNRQQPVDIPSFTIATNKGKLTVAAAHFAPAGATVGSSGISLGEAASGRLEPSSGSVWAGEVFDLKYTIEVGAGYSPSWGRGVFDWDPTPLVVEDWSQPEPFNTDENGLKTGLTYRTRALAPDPGRVRLNPTSQLVNLSVGVTGFGFFQQRQYQQFAVPDTPVAINVRPLPPAPQWYTGAVGDFRIASKVVPTHVKAGEPITWTIELSGSGNWPEFRGLPSREVSDDFQVIQPKPKRTQAPGKLFDSSLTEDVVLIGTRAGTYSLPSLDFIYFDPRSGSYRTITAPGGAVTVEEAAPIGGQGPGPLAPALGVPKISSEAPTVRAQAPEAPAPGLGDPVPPSGAAPGPVRLRTIALACALPFALLALFWAVLALGRARATDPLRARREARARLAATVDALRSAPSRDEAALLLAWQRDTALLWGVAHAAPPASCIADPQWSGLWAEADRFLYGAGAALPADWIGRAQAALDAKALPRFALSSLLLPRNLLPFLFLAAAAALPAAIRGADAQSTYLAGNFAAAADAWGAAASADPLDWSARHNLSLALAQQDRWGESAAQASAAFVQNPSNPSVRRQLALSCDKAGFVPEPVEALLQQGPLEALARLDSPGGWQRKGAGAAAAAAVSLGLLLAAAYGLAGRRWALPGAVAALCLSLLAWAACLAAHRAYGIAANDRAVIVWRSGTLRSVPTEADVSQKTTPLPAGSAAVADKSFIGWVRLSFPNGETGWVARTELVYLWRSGAR
jgi:hypothetical protein